MQDFVRELNKRFNLIMIARDVHDPAVLLAVHDYYQLAEKATLSHEEWHRYWHEVMEEWNKALYLAEDRFHKKLKDFSREENEVLHQQSEFYIAPAYEELRKIYEDVENQKAGEKPSRKDYQRRELVKEFLNRVHPTIISKIEEDLGKTNALGKEEKVGKKSKPVVTIVIDDKRGIYRESNPKLKYGIDIKSKRFQVINFLMSKGRVGMSDLEKETNQKPTLVLKEISAINDLFRSKLGLADDLIIHHDTGGYSLNTDKFHIRMEV